MFTERFGTWIGEVPIPGKSSALTKDPKSKNAGKLLGLREITVLELLLSRFSFRAGGGVPAVPQRA
jgi:hypothetical protein